MPYIQVNDRRFALRVGQTRIGAGPDVEIRIAAAPGAAANPGPATVVDATVDLSPENTAAIRRAAPEAQVRVNGVQLGPEPTPLIHGDKIEILGADLYFGDDRKGGSTQFISAGSIPELHRLRPQGAPSASGGATGGRVISLVDGREYAVGVTGLAFGRDPACDVVIPSSEVSRRHAEIQLGEDGYVVTDTSTNGLFVNGDRVEGSRLLRRGDVIRMGNEDFRFYADMPARATAPPPAAAGQPAPGPVGSPAPQEPPVVPVTAGSDAGPALGAAAPAPADSAAPSAPAASVLSAAETPPVEEGQRRPAPLPPPATAPAPRAVATLTVLNAGPMRGHAYAITSILAHVGRGTHNEVVIVEESVSDSHATLQRRDGIWYVTDLGSTNGTYVNGRPIHGEQQIGQSGELRVGGVKLGFAAALGEPLTAPRGATRAIAGAGVPEISGRGPEAPGLAASAAPSRERQAAPAPELPEPVDRGGTAWLWAVALVLIAAAAYILFKSW